MKKAIFLTILLFSGLCLSYSGDYTATILLKNGIVLDGTIAEKFASDQVLITTIDGNRHICRLSEIGSVSFQDPQPNLDEYGGTLSTGLAIGGGGILGMPVRYYLNPMIVLEIGPYFRPVLVSDNDAIKSYSGFAIAGGANIFLNKYYKSHKDKIKLNGISIKTGYGSSSINTMTFISGGWAHESFQAINKNRSFIFELGMGYMSSEMKRGSGYDEVTSLPVLIYWKINWNWFLL